MAGVNCVIPAGVLNSHWTVSGQTLQYQCADGFRMTGGSASRTCINGTNTIEYYYWTGSPPQCTQIETIPWWIPILFGAFFGLLFLLCLLLLCCSFCCGYKLPLFPESLQRCRCCRCPGSTSRRRRRRRGSNDSGDSNDPAGVYVIPHGKTSHKQSKTSNRVGAQHNVIIHEEGLNNQRALNNKTVYYESPSTQNERVKHEYFTRLPNGDLIPFTKPTPYKPPKHKPVEEHYLRLPNGELVPIDKKDVKNYKPASNPSSIIHSHQNVHQTTPDKNKRFHDVASSDDGLVPVDSPKETEFYTVVDRVVETNRTRDAKDLQGWMPHSKPRRNINTSTK